MKLDKIDNGKEFYWGKASKDYGLYRDIYPESFYEKLHIVNVGVMGQKVLDLGTGTCLNIKSSYT